MSHKVPYLEVRWRRNRSEAAHMLRAMRQMLALLASLVGFGVLVPVAHASLIPAHSHWDVHSYTNHEIKFCYHPLASTSGAGSTIAFLPLREVNSQNFMQLDIKTTGFALQRRVNGVFTTDTPTFQIPSPPAHPIGSSSANDIMVDFVMDGSTFTLYQLNPDLSRGAELYQWQDSTFPSGVNISYYTQPHYEGQWEFVHAFPIDGGTGEPHDIFGLFQDARNHNSVTGAATFDDPTPAQGDAIGLTGSTSTFGLPSGNDYTYQFQVSGSAGGSAHVDFRDPGDSSNEVYFQHGFYRFTVPQSGDATIQQYSGSGTLQATHKASMGGDGTYDIEMAGSSFTLLKADAQILAFTGSGPLSGLRVRVVPGNQTWSWSGCTDATGCPLPA